MLTPQECGDAAEIMIATYCRAVMCHSADDVRKAGEMLISKMARGIEKYAGNEAAVDVLNRTLLHVGNPTGEKN